MSSDTIALSDGVAEYTQIGFTTYKKTTSDTIA